MLWSTWEHAQAIAFMRIPEIQQHKKYGDKSDCAKKLYNLGNTASIRSKGIWANGQPASEEDRKWAENHWPFNVEKALEGANGILSKCRGELA